MKVSLFVTCLIDQLLPEAGAATVDLLRRLGHEVEFRSGQTCCGQPAFNSGFQEESRKVAEHFLRVFAGAECIVAPSGSCAGFIRNYLPRLFPLEAASYRKARELATRTYELSEFLVEVSKTADVGAQFQGRATYHDSCHALRELRVRAQPRMLLGHVRGLELREMPQIPTCCGFGGLFSVTFPEVSGSILEEKLRAIASTGAETVISADAGCILQIRGGAAQRGMNLQTLHLAQVLASTR